MCNYGVQMESEDWCCTSDAFNVGVGLLPVSYTHLDVYKRQLRRRVVGKAQAPYYPFSQVIPDVSSEKICRSDGGSDSVTWHISETLL